MELLKDMLSDVVSFLLGNGGYSQVKAFITDAISSITTQNGSFVASAYNVFKGAAIALMVIYFFIELYDLVMRNKFSGETFVKALVKFLLVYLVIENALPLIGGAINIGSAASSSTNVLDVADSSITGMEEINMYIDSLDGLYAVGAIAKGIIPMLIMWITSLLLYFLAIGRTIELVARAMLAPIALSNLFGEGSRNAGIQYLRKLVAVGLQGAVIILILFAGSTFMKTYNSIPTEEDMNKSNAIYLSKNGSLHLGEKSSVSDGLSKGGIYNLPSATTYKLASGDKTPLYTFADKALSGTVENQASYTSYTQLPNDGNAGEQYTENPNTNVQVSSGNMKLFEFLTKELKKPGKREQAKQVFVGQVLYTNLMDLHNIIMFTIVQFACVGAALRSQTIANDLMGV